MNIASELLAGSTRVDIWRKEITSVVNIVLGFLKEEDYAELDLADEKVLDESKYHRWTIQDDGGGSLRFRMFSFGPNDAEELVCELPGGQIRMYHVGYVHAQLDSLVRGLRNLIPDLHNRWRQLLSIANDGLQMYFELQFREPSDDPLEMKYGGKLLRYRKKCDLTFPLPLDTEVFVGLEGEPSQFKVLVIDGKEMFDGRELPVDDDGDCFFKVTGYESMMHDSFGHLTVEKLVMILEPQESWEGVPLDAHFPHLLSSNGWECLD